MDKSKTKDRAEHFLTKKYRNKLWTPFIHAIKDFELVEEGDVIAVAISGGKDSFLLAKLFEQLHKYGKQNFSIKLLSMDPGYQTKNRELIESNARLFSQELHYVEKEVFEVAKKMDEKKTCYLCARMRRGILYETAQKLGCNKIALGHHYDDVIQTILMNVLSSGNYMSMMPKLKSKNYEGMQLIRPLYYVREKDVIAWKEAVGLTFLDCACEATSRDVDSNRVRVAQLIEQLKQDFPNVEQSIFSSSKNVFLDGVISWKKDGKRHHFLEEYTEEKGYNEEERKGK